MSVGTDGRVTHGRGHRTPAPEAGPSREEQITAAVAEIAESRAVIEQAKGMLTLVYGIDAGAAFELLRWQSQNYNVKLRLVAEQIAKDFTVAARQPPVDRATYDNLLLTAHGRASFR